MKRHFLLAIIIGTILTGCHVDRSITTLTQSPQVKYKLVPFPNDTYPNYYVFSAPGFKRSTAALVHSLSIQLEGLDKRISSATALDIESLREKQAELIGLIKQFSKDTTVNYIVSFTDNLKGIDYSIVRVYWWDYSNWRFLVPFVSYFNRQHNYNQCVNRAIGVCLDYCYDGVILSGDLSTFKLFVVNRSDNSSKPVLQSQSSPEIFTPKVEPNKSPTLKEQPSSTTKSTLKLQIGDLVTFENAIGRIMEGKILRIDGEKVFVEYQTPSGKTSEAQLFEYQLKKKE